MKHWSGLPREVGGALSLETFKVRLEGPLSNLIELMSLLIAEGLDWMTFKGPLQRKLFYDSLSLLLGLCNYALLSA